MARYSDSLVAPDAVVAPVEPRQSEATIIFGEDAFFSDVAMLGKDVVLIEGHQQINDSNAKAQDGWTLEYQRLSNELQNLDANIR